MWAVGPALCFTGPGIFKQEEDITFWTLTSQCFMEAPFRLGEGTAVYHAGERTLGGKTYDLVFVSWGTDAPQETIDQYVAWIERDTGRLGFLQYTIRDFLQSAKGTMIYSGYKDIEGFQLPMRLTVVGEPDEAEDVVHVMEVKGASFGGVDEGLLLPAPERL